MAGPTSNPNRFIAPTPERLAEHLQQHPPIEQGPGINRLLIVFVVAVVASVALQLVPDLAWLAIFPLVGLILYLGFLGGQRRKQQVLHHQVVRAWELALIRRHREALRRAWTLLPEVTDQPELHGRCVAVIAHVLDELAQRDAAAVAFDYLIDRLPKAHPLAVRVQLQQATAAVASGRLADADDALRKLRPVAEDHPDTQLSASYYLARLVQDTMTGHFAEAAAHAQTTLEQLRPLGVEAGYGHGLLAYCCDQLAHHQEDAAAATRYQQDAAKYWRAATMLLPPAALAFRYPELAGMSERVD